LTIAEGYHINANPATFPYLRETKVEVAPAQGIAIAKVDYPPPVTRQFRFEKQPLKVYEREAVIRLKLQAAANAAKGSQTLHAQVQVQPCDEEKCFPPTKIPADIPVTID
jgi:DsbC/DsbD-like thiol-disulfide interchange protein